MINQNYPSARIPRMQPPPDYRDNLKNFALRNSGNILILAILLGFIILLNGYCNGKYALEEKQTINKTK